MSHTEQEQKNRKRGLCWCGRKPRPITTIPLCPTCYEIDAKVREAEKEQLAELGRVSVNLVMREEDWAFFKTRRKEDRVELISRMVELWQEVNRHD